MRLSRGIRLPGWPATMLAAAFALLVAIAWQVYSTERTRRTTVRTALRDYAAFMSWSYAEHARVELDRAFLPFLSLVGHAGLHRTRPVPRAGELILGIPYDQACSCLRVAYVPAALVSFVLGSDTMSIADSLPLTRAGRATASLREEAPPAVDKARLKAMVFAATPADHQPRRLHVRASPSGGGSLIGYMFMPTVWGDTVVYGEVLDGSETGALLSGVLTRERLLPDVLTREHLPQDVAQAAVGIEDGGPVWTSDSGPQGDIEATQRMDRPYEALVVKTTMRPTAARFVGFGESAASAFPLPMAMLFVAAGLTVVALLQLRRQTQMNREHADFVAAVSHELRTPLAQVWLYFDTMRLGRFSTPQSQDDAMEGIEAELGRLTHLVDNILQFVRGERGARPEEPELISLSGEVRNAVAAFSPLAQIRGVRIEVEVDTEVRVRIGRLELRQVILNLLDNAVKYGPDGQTIRVRAVLQEQGAVLEVSDEGPGVLRSERSRIWDSFHRGARDVERAVGGTGIGLSVIREIVERVGGTAGVGDAPNGGACFVIRLPGESAERAAQEQVPRADLCKAAP